MSMFSAISQSVSAEMPCGPDPELDPEIQNFLAVAEAQLPASYREFNRKAFDAKPILEKLQSLLAKSKDIRFLVLAAKFAILSDDLPGFVDALVASLELLESQWDHCHPTEQAGGNALRAAFLKTLDDLPTSVLPLQNTTLVNDKRLGVLTWRSVLVANRKIQPKEGEETHDLETIRDALVRFEPETKLTTLLGQLARISASLQKIRDLFLEKAGFEVAPHFDQLPELVKEMSGFLSAIVAVRNPAAVVTSAEAEINGDSAAVASEDGAHQISDSASLASVKEASNALEGVLTYYSVSEPSSPARLLIKQAHQLVGKSFVEAMRVLAPGLTEATNIKIGGDAPFTLDFSQLSALAEDGTDASSGEGEARSFSAATRAEASVLMRSVEQFYKRTEPSSPIPLLVEKARTFAAKDFTSLLKEMVKRDDQQT
jgi:type VI secretion system protein ImpA